MRSIFFKKSQYPLSSFKYLYRSQTKMCVCVCVNNIEFINYFKEFRDCIISLLWQKNIVHFIFAHASIVFLCIAEVSMNNIQAS